jgi:NAD(P)-dependent dehydrogenase (short-subunit alcohol dehydrogenase family)
MRRTADSERRQHRRVLRVDARFRMVETDEYISPERLLMRDSLLGKRALVTGASSGIGLATAQLLAEHGATVLGLAKHWNEMPDGIRCVVGDVTNQADVTAAVDQAADDSGLDILVANAGVADLDAWHDGSADSWLRVLDVNLVGVMRCFQTAAANMIANGRKGRLLATTSVAGLRPFANAPAYAASKAGVISVVESAALAFAPHEITANAVAPGHIADTVLHSVVAEAGAGIAGRSVGEHLSEWAAVVPLGRFGAPNEIAHAFLFLTSEAAAYITGATLCIDGGLTRVWPSGA